MKKQEKKFVLAALVLLAITGLLALAGCKNDSVPEPTRYTVKFETAHGTAPADITVVSGTKLTDKDLAIEPEVGDNIFEYWYGKDDDAQKPVEEGYTVTKDVTLVAKWRDRGTVASVTFTPPDGTKFYLGELIEVSLSSQEGATIHYTVNGGEEKNGASPVTVSVTGDTTITARATKDELKPSAVTSATYTVRQLEGISVTPSTRTVYSVGEKVAGEIEVTATYDDGEERTVTGTITTDTSTLTQSAGIGKTVTVSYTEGETTKTTTFTVDVASYQFTETVQDVDSSYTGTMTDGDYKKFGDWPQTIKDENVTVGKNTMTRGGMDFHVGSDGNYYVEQKENANGSGTAYLYSNGEPAGQGGTSTKWFKVEPIVWRVLTTSYKAPEDGTAGNALLLAEKILTGGIPYYDVKGTDRTVDRATIYPNNYEHSAVRAWLNGLEYLYKKDDNTAQTTEKKYLAAGFLQTAFTESAQTLIADTSVDNSAASTNPASNPKQWEEGENPYASNTPTKDKVFLLSEEEATTSEYDFDEYNKYVGDDYDTTTSTRIRVTTDYAKATGADQSSISGRGGWWWRRSPRYDYESYACAILHNGRADNSHTYGIVDSARGGVVPALSISLQ